jgi:adenosine deaminase
VLEVCPSSNLNTRVLANTAEVRHVVRALLDHDVRFTISTDGPEMLRSYLRDELQLLLRHEILSLEEIEQAVETGREASFLDRAPTISSSVAGLVGELGRASMPVGAGT